jgi:hypothetical protein
MATIGTSRLKIVNDQPSIDKLENGRYRLEFFCSNDGKKTDWYADNIDLIFPAFGALQSDAFAAGTWVAPSGSVYSDMRLVEAGTQYVPAANQHYVKLVYETITASYAQIKDDTVDYELNGLRSVSRTSIAIAGIAYTGVVGVTTIAHNDPDGDGTVTLYLASYKIDENDAAWVVTERWVEAGELSRSTDLVGSQNALIISTIGGAPATPAGYSLAKTDINNVGGLQSTSYTFLKPSVLSRSEDIVGSQKAIVIEAFGEVPTTPNNYVLARKQESDFEGIKTNSYTYLKINVELSRTEDKVGSQLAIVIEQFNGTPFTPSGYAIANTQVSDVVGIPTRRYTFLKDNVLLSETEDKVGSQLAKVQEWFNPTTDPVITDYVIANTQVSDVGGIPTKRYTFLKEDVELSRSEDKVGSQLAIVTEIFKPASDPAESGYSVARTEVSDVDGIPTKRFTFLKEDVELSRSEDKVGSQLAITIEVFKPDADPTEEGYSVARTEVSDVEGIPTKRFTFLKEDVELFHTEDFEGGLNEIVEEWFKPEAGRDEKADYVLIEKTESDLGGIPTEKYTFWKEKGLIHESYVNEAEGVIRTTQVFFSEVDDDLVKGPIVSKDTKNIDGIPTITVTTLQGSTGISIIGDGERLANSYDQLVSFTYPGVVSIQSNPVGPLFTSYAWRLSPPVECVVNATTYVIFQDSNSIVASDYTYADASGHWNPTEWAKGECYGLGYSYTPFSESKGFRGYRADAMAVQVYENAPDNYLINGNRLYEDTTGGINIYGGPEDPSLNKYVLDVKITPAFVDIDGNTKYKKVIVVATIPQQENTAVPVPETPEP